MILRNLTLAALRSSNILISLKSSWFTKFFFFFRRSIFFILLANLTITGLLPAFRDGSLCAIDISFSDIWASIALLMSTTKTKKKNKQTNYSFHTSFFVDQRLSVFTDLFLCKCNFIFPR